MKDKLVDSINRVKKLYKSCNDKSFNVFVGHVIAGDIKVNYLQNNKKSNK